MRKARDGYHYRRCSPPQLPDIAFAEHAIIVTDVFNNVGTGSADVDPPELAVCPLILQSGCDLVWVRRYNESARP